MERGPHPRGVARHIAAVLASGSRVPALRHLRVPSLVIHGRADPLIPPAGGLATAAAIPAAKLRLIPGMGHDLPRALWPAIAGELVAHARGADRRRAAA